MGPGIIAERNSRNAVRNLYRFHVIGLGTDHSATHAAWILAPLLAYEASIRI